MPGVAATLVDLRLSPVLGALLFGGAIVGAAFLLSWAAEVAQLFISAGLAIALLAFIAVLPEYAVDMVFAIKGGREFRAAGFDPTCLPPGGDGRTSCSLALANMTGSNRLLIGVGWSMVVLLAVYRMRVRRRRASRPEPDGVAASRVTLARRHAVDVAFLLLATVYSLSLPLKRSITLVDAAVLLGIFVLYTIRISRAPAEAPDLVGPARWIESFGSRPARLAACIVLFVLAATAILLCAEPFAGNLVTIGQERGLSEFLVVQWLAPLASESPELLVTGLYAWRLNTDAGLGTLLSAKVYQWTLLVGTLPVVFALASASRHGLPVNGTQRDALLLTVAFSLFALSVLVELTISRREVLLIFGVFGAQLVLGAILPTREVRIMAVVILAVAVMNIVRRAGLTMGLVRDGLVTPYRELSAVAD